MNRSLALSMTTVELADSEFRKKFGSEPTALVVNPYQEFSAHVVCAGVPVVGGDLIFRSRYVVMVERKFKDLEWALRGDSGEMRFDPDASDEELDGA